FDISSSSYGSTSRLDILSVDANTENDIGLSVGSGLDGTDVAGTINGLVATGSGQLLTSASGESDGLVLSVTSATTGNLGSMTFTKGISQMLDDLVSSFIDTDGFIESRESGFNSELDSIAEERLELGLKIESLEARLVRQYSALDSLIASFNSTSNFLTSQLSSLIEPNTISKK
ncbi:MAG: flagellar filament capping protein FliD, partial [Thiotrichaceae bacterium]|nr:flagellar filament capping protein FliD [Thiotrichaceae bacterium]